MDPVVAVTDENGLATANARVGTEIGWYYYWPTVFVDDELTGLNEPPGEDQCCKFVVYASSPE